MDSEIKPNGTFASNCRMTERGVRCIQLYHSRWDHHTKSGSMLMAGGGIKGGVTYGETDPFGFTAQKDPFHVIDFHATALHLLGVEHKKLTYKYKGRNFRLTDVHGHVVDQILA